MDGFLTLALGRWLLPVYGVKLALLVLALVAFLYARPFKERSRVPAGLALLGSLALLSCAYEPAFPYLGRNGALFAGVLLLATLSRERWPVKALEALMLTALLMPAQALSFEFYAQVVMRPRYIGYSPVQYLAFHLFDLALALGMVAAFYYFRRAGLVREMDRRTGLALAAGAGGVLLLFDYYIRQYGLVAAPLNRVHVLILGSSIGIFLLFLLAGLFFQNRRLARSLVLAEQDYSGLLKKDLQAYHRLTEHYYDAEHDRINRLKALHRLILYQENQTALEKMEQWLAYKGPFLERVAPLTGDQLVDAVLRVKQEEAGEIPLDMQVTGYFPKGDHEDMAMVLANLLDNALEAARTADRPQVSLNLIIKYGMIRATLINTWVPQDNKQPGRGLSIVRRILEAQNGRMTIRTRDDYYRVDIFAYLNVDPD
ncbi:GHKL domain-containing protein [Peptococcus simiae]|uniref:GHKL domain-containing protein n=1 Tax=Peptococcus simiae TaxID=1643805 RepID=UPI0039819138